MATEAGDAALPFVDEHAVHVAAPPDAVWESLDRHVRGSLLLDPDRLLPRILDAKPREGFAVASSLPPSTLRLIGRHRFSDYALEFFLEGIADGTILRARSLAAFPGWRGRVYRALVIGSGGHRMIVRRMLRGIARGTVDYRST